MRRIGLGIWRVNYSRLRTVLSSLKMRLSRCG